MADLVNAAGAGEEDEGCTLPSFTSAFSRQSKDSRLLFVYTEDEAVTMEYPQLMASLAVAEVKELEKMINLSAAMAGQFAWAFAEMTVEIKRIGPNPLGRIGILIAFVAIGVSFGAFLGRFVGVDKAETSYHLYCQGVCRGTKIVVVQAS